MYKWIQNDIKLATDISLSLFLVLDHLRGNSVHVSGAFLGERLSSKSFVTVISLVLDLSSETLFFELFQAVLNDLGSSFSVVRSFGSVSLGSTVVLSEAGDVNFTSHVHLVCKRCSSGVEPVWVIGAEFLEAGGLGVLGPLNSETR